MKSKKGKSLKGTNPFYDDYNWDKPRQATTAVESDDDSDSL